MIIFGTCRDPKMEDEIKIVMVAAAFPVVSDVQQNREVDLQRLLQDATPEAEEELDVPSFLRRQSGSRSRGFFR
jgi:cell division GTPase FtsZ